MVQAVDSTDTLCEEQDVPQALVLLGEMNNAAQHVGQLVDNMIQQVHKGELSTSQGLNFLEMKYHMLLSYLINVTYVVLRKCCGETIEGDPTISRLIEIRTVLEKIKPIDRKLKYQIDKLVKSAVTGLDDDDPSVFRANPENFVNEGEESSEDDGEMKDGTTKDKSGVYVPPKLAAVHYTGDETTAERNKRMAEKARKNFLHSSIIQDLRDEYLDTPVEVSHSNRAQQKLTKQEKEKQEYEENYLTRLPVTKAEKQRQKQLSTIGNLGNELTNFSGKSFSGSSLKRKRKSNRGKGNKKRRYH